MLAVANVLLLTEKAFFQLDRLSQVLLGLLELCAQVLDGVLFAEVCEVLFDRFEVVGGVLVESLE